MKSKISNEPCNRSAETFELISRFDPLKSSEGGLQTNSGIATTGQTANRYNAREMLHLANLVFAFIECRAGGDQEVLYFLRLGERALCRVGDLLGG